MLKQFDKNKKGIKMVLLAHELVETSGQYSIDHAYDPHNPLLKTDPNGVKAARGDGSSVMHDPDLSLFDEADSNLPDPATGLPPAARESDPNHDLIRNGLSIVDAVDEEIRQRRRPDAAEKWLRQFDPENPHYKPPKAETTAQLDKK